MSRMSKMRMMSKFLTNRGRGRPDPRAGRPPDAEGWMSKMSKMSMMSMF